jgi:hypothetical protein
VLLPCVVGRLSRWGCMTRDWAWGTVGTCMGWAWLVHGCGEPLRLALCGVGLAGAGGTGVTWPRLGTLKRQPCWVMQRVWGRGGSLAVCCVPGPVAEAWCVMCCVSWYLGPVAVACCHGLGFCVMWQLGWVSENMAGVCKRRTSRVSPWWGLPCCL